MCYNQGVENGGSDNIDFNGNGGIGMRRNICRRFLLVLLAVCLGFLPSAALIELTEGRLGPLLPVRVSDISVYRDSFLENGVMKATAEIVGSAGLVFWVSVFCWNHRDSAMKYVESNAEYMKENYKL